MLLVETAFNPVWAWLLLGEVPGGARAGGRRSDHRRHRFCRRCGRRRRCRCRISSDGRHADRNGADHRRPGAALAAASLAADEQRPDARRAAAGRRPRRSGGADRVVRIEFTRRRASRSPSARSTHAEPISLVELAGAAPRLSAQDRRARVARGGARDGPGRRRRRCAALRRRGPAGRGHALGDGLVGWRDALFPAARAGRARECGAGAAHGDGARRAFARRC